MDPNAVLAALRILVTQSLSASAGQGPIVVHDWKQHAVELAEHVDALDSWLSTGGFKPDAWTGDSPKTPRRPTIVVRSKR